MKNKLILFSILLTIYGCRSSSDYFYKALDYNLDFESKDTGERNPLNDDNVIYKTNYVFTYDYEIVDSNGKSLNCMIYHDTILEKFAWTLIHKKRKNEDENVTLDKVRLTVFENDATDSGLSIGKQQTIIKYNYTGLFGQELAYGARTGVIEDSTRIFLHPPRGHCFIWAAIQPYPEIEFPLQIWKSWTSTLTTPPSVYREVNDDYGMLPTLLKKTHTIVGKEKIKTPLGELDCYVTEAIGVDEEVNYYAKTIHYFNEKYGFVRIIYQNNFFPYTIKLNLESVTQQ